jgi:hypothetical protein
MSPRTCGADTFVREKPEARVNQARANAILAAMIGWFAGLFDVVAAVLQEIFDESAYKRFLDRTHLESSPNAYAVFCQENEQSKSRRPKCC